MAIARFLVKRKSFLISASCAGLLAVAPLVPVDADAFWGCSAGYQLQIRQSNNQHVRCYRPADTRDISANCPQVTLPTGQKVGSGYVQDYYSDGRDACVTQDPTGTAKTAVAHNFCPFAGYSLDKRQNRDRCERPADTKAPTVNVP